MKSVLWPLLKAGLSRIGHLARSDGLGPVQDTAEAGNRLIDRLAGSFRDRPIGLFLKGVRPVISNCGRRVAQPIAITVVTLFTGLMLMCGGALAVPPGTEIPNTALAIYDFGGMVEIESPSNMVVIITTGPRTPSTLEFMHYAPGCPDAELVKVPITYFSTTGTEAGPFVPIPPPGLMSDPVPPVPGAAVALKSTDCFRPGEPIFLRLTDLDQNSDPHTAETVLVGVTVCHTVESELLRLTETGTGTGVFAGYIEFISDQPATANNGTVTVHYEHKILAEYTDGSDGSDISRSASWTNTTGIAFDTSTGLPVNGVAITLIDVDTGLPVTVHGIDGHSLYPSTVVTGERVIDSSGREYGPQAGAFRFPFPEPGTQRLKVVPPEGYSAPSTVPTEVIQTLPGAPFSIVEPASRGGSFVVKCRFSTRIDIPIDPAGTELFLTKAADREWVTVGDFVGFSLKVENTSPGPFGKVMLRDRLPPGFAYQAGSTTIDGTGAPDPEIASDGRMLEFLVGSLSSNSTSRVRYVTEAAAGVVPGPAVNTAVAADTSGIISNTARARVRVIEDPLTARSLIVGSVTACDSCATCDSAEAGLAGVRIMLEDGTYTLTDRRGMFHFQAVRPGVHVVQLDPASLPPAYTVVSCERNSRFAGRPYSRFVDLEAGTMWRADFHIAPKPRLAGEVGLELASIVRGDVTDYLIRLSGSAVPVGNLRVQVMLPDGVTYVDGSSDLDGLPIDDPSVVSNVLTYRLGDAGAGWEQDLSFSGGVSRYSEPGELTTRALLTFDSPTQTDQRTPVAENVIRIEDTRSSAEHSFTMRPHFATLSAELGQEDRQELDEVIDRLETSEVTLVEADGHTDSRRIRERSQHLFADNYALSLARARSVGDYLARGFGLDPSRVEAEGKGPDEPVAGNETVEGRALNRRVEALVTAKEANGERILEPTRARDRVVANTLGTRGGEEPDSPEEETQATAVMPDYSETWLASAEPGLEWLWPETGFYPSIPSLKIVIKHRPGNRLVLFLNGGEVDPLNFDKTLEGESGEVALSRWSGIDLEEGDNHFRLAVRDDGGKTRTIERTIHYSGPPVRAELVREVSRLSANGMDSPVIAVRLVDSYDCPARTGVVGAYSVDPPHLSLEEFDTYQRFPLSGMDKRKPQYTVGSDGIALIELQPTAMSGEATVRFNFVDGEQEMRVWLEPEARDWILVGLAEGTLGYNTVSTNMEDIEPGDVEDEFHEDGRVAFYAKGRIKGSWLLTMAYDTERYGTGAGRGFFQTVDPAAYYTLYGDATQQYYDSPSGEHLYLRLERREFYALFGDYSTGLTITELSRYSRTFTGIKSELRTGPYAFNLYAAETGQAFIRDEIRGDGTSGLYRLSHRGVIFNSEKVMLETRDRFRSELIVSSRRLMRHLDYDIDLEAGTLFFREPVPSKDEDLNHIFIVIDYESEEESAEAHTYGGRGAVLLGGQAVELGATYVHEGEAGGEGDLAGVDARLRVGAAGELRVEFAATRVETGEDEVDGTAYLGEYRHRWGGGDYRFYVRELDRRFGLGQQNAGEIGTRKFGIDAMHRFNHLFWVDGLAYRHYNLVTDAVRDVGEARLNFSSDRYALRAGFRYASDELDGGTKTRSDQLTIGATCKLFSSSLRLRLDHHQSVGGRNANPDYPTCTIVGSDYDIGRNVMAFAEYEVTQGDHADTQASRFGLKATPWTGARVNSSLKRRFNEAGTRVFANLGLRQTWCFHDRWCVDASIDHSRMVKYPDSPAFNENVPPASGADNDFVAVSTGLAYREPTWSATSRLEWRRADQEEKWTLIANTFGEPREDLGFSVGGRLLRASRDDGLDRIAGDIRLGLAVRPSGSRWTVLDRLDLRTERCRGNGSYSDRRQIVNNLNTNYRVTGQDQVAFQYGSKYTGQDIGASHFTGYTDIIGLELRHDLSERWDVGLRGSRLHSWNSSTSDYGAGLSVGYNVVTNTWISLGYNIIGFRDKDFSDGNYTAQGPFLRLRLKVDQETLSDGLGIFSTE